MEENFDYQLITEFNLKEEHDHGNIRWGYSIVDQKKVPTLYMLSLLEDLSEFLLKTSHRCCVDPAAAEGGLI